LDECAHPVPIGDAQAAIAPFDQSRLLKLVLDLYHGRAGEIDQPSLADAVGMLVHGWPGR
jgi:hypothetical protein